MVTRTDESVSENKQTITPGLDTRVVDWYQQRSAWLGRDFGGRSRLTLAWTYGQDVFHYVEAEDGWDRFLDDGAFCVLREWEGCVERVVYGVGGGPYTSTVLGTVNGVEKQLVKFIPKQHIHVAHHWLILQGRYVCLARRPKCEECKITHFCRHFEKNVQPKMLENPENKG